MKSVVRSFARAAARWALSYAGEAAAYILDRAAAKTAGRASLLRLLSWAEDTAALFALFARTLRDGSVTPEERAAVSDEAQRVADRAKELLK